MRHFLKEHIFFQESEAKVKIKMAMEEYKNKLRVQIAVEKAALNVALARRKEILAELKEAYTEINKHMFIQQKIESVILPEIIFKKAILQANIIKNAALKNGNLSPPMINCVKLEDLTDHKRIEKMKDKVKHFRENHNSNGLKTRTKATKSKQTVVVAKRRELKKGEKALKTEIAGLKDFDDLKNVQEIAEKME